MEDKNVNETVNERYVYHQNADATKSEHQNWKLYLYWSSDRYNGWKLISETAMGSYFVGGNSRLDQHGSVCQHKPIKWPALWAYVTNYKMDGQSIS